jgi:hypothetical protein
LLTRQAAGSLDKKTVSPTSERDKVISVDPGAITQQLVADVLAAQQAYLTEEQVTEL